MRNLAAVLALVLLQHPLRAVMADHLFVAAGAAVQADHIARPRQSLQAVRVVGLVVTQQAAAARSALMAQPLQRVARAVLQTRHAADRAAVVVAQPSRHQPTAVLAVLVV